MSKSKVFIGVSISFAVGVWVASAFSISTLWAFWVLGGAGVALAVGILNSSRITLLTALFLFCVAAGIFRFQQSLVSNQFQDMLGTKQELEGHIVEDPDIRIDKQLLTIRPTNFSQNILVTTTLTNNYDYGDWVVINGKIAEAKNFDDFDYKGYLERYNVYAVVSYPKILILKNGQGNIFKEKILQIKHAFVDRVSNFIGEPHRSLLLGILIGAKKTLPQEIIDNFNNTGTSHIIAISGYNITIIISSLAFLAFYFGRRGSFWFSLLLIISFVVLAGASASVIRAAVMGFLLLVSSNIGRQYSVTPAMFFAGFIMLLLNPRILYWDVGFQLSFVATMGIVYFVPLLERLTQRLNFLGQIKNILIVTLSATAVTLPIILLYFGTLSFTAPLVNILVLPIVPTIMLFGFLSVSPLVGAGFAFLDKLLLSYVLFITNFFAHLPHGTMTVKISAWIAAGLATALLMVYFVLRRLSRKMPVVESSVRM